MSSITEYKELIKEIPVSKQSSTVKRESWDTNRFSLNHELINKIFHDEKTVEISRENVFLEKDPTKKFIMVLMWGYPTGGRGNNIKNTLNESNKLIKLLSSKKINGNNLDRFKANDVIDEFSTITGLGISTWSKLLYFYNISIESKKCQIFDQKIVDSLNKQQFDELDTQKWKQDIKHYYDYIELTNNLAKRMDVKPDQIELFLFYYNLYYKFS